VIDLTDIKGSFDFRLDWIARPADKPELTPSVHERLEWKS
jgi:hypothetical protein